MSGRLDPNRYQALIRAAFELTTLRARVRSLAAQVHESEVTQWIERIENLETRAIHLLDVVEGPRASGH